MDDVNMSLMMYTSELLLRWMYISIEIEISHMVGTVEHWSKAHVVPTRILNCIQDGECSGLNFCWSRRALLYEDRCTDVDIVVAKNMWMLCNLNHLVYAL